MLFQSALIIPVPEAEPLVSDLRNRFDPSASAGVPAHITINYPFLQNAADDPGVVSLLASRFSDHRSFSYSLTHVERFPGIVYLVPSPDHPFFELIQAVAELFPQSPPSGGSIDKVTPHLTVAASDDLKILEAAREHLVAACEGKLPIQACASEIALLDNRSGLWTKRISFLLPSA